MPKTFEESVQLFISPPKDAKRCAEVDERNEKFASLRKEIVSSPHLYTFVAQVIRMVSEMEGNALTDNQAIAMLSFLTGVQVGIEMEKP